MLKSLPFVFQKEFNTVIKRNLTLGKENKWLMKNTLLSYDLITKASSTTHLKKLYGNPQFNSNVMNNNIWMSNHLSKSDDFAKSNTGLNSTSLNVLKTNSLNTPTLTNLNNLEESFFWLVKRFTFLQTTSTYSQFNTRNNLISSTSSVDRTELYDTTHDIFKNIVLVNTMNFDTYNLHLISNKINNNQSLLQTTNTTLDISSQKAFNEYDLTFSKYLFNNLTLQKNTLLVYSNLDS
jgi:hypothetical protein